MQPRLSAHANGRAIRAVTLYIATHSQEVQCSLRVIRKYRPARMRADRSAARSLGGFVHRGDLPQAVPLRIEGRRGKAARGVGAA